MHRATESPTKSECAPALHRRGHAPRAAYGNRADAGRDLTLGQMPVAHHSLAAISSQLVGMVAEEARNLDLHSVRQQCSRVMAQNLCQRIGKRPWLGELDHILLGQGVSLLR